MIARRLARPQASWTSSSWTCPACQSRTAATPSPAQTRLNASPFRSQQRRGILSMPRLAYEEYFDKHGIPKLFSRSGYQLGWSNYQRMIVNKLKQQLAGEPWENATPKQLVLRFARDPMNASLFNHASMAFNNNFFYSTMAPEPSGLEKHSVLRASLAATFGSIDTLHDTLIDTAEAMFGPGYVWLVWAHDAPPIGSVPASTSSMSPAGTGDWRILTTYIAGTPFPEAGARLQAEDMSTADATRQPANTVGAFGPHSAGPRERATLAPGTSRITPALCVSTWQHVYIYDFGLPGKRKFLENWWAQIHWGAVASNVPQTAYEHRAGFLGV